MDAAIKHPVPDRVKPASVIFDIWALWPPGLSARVPGCQKLQMMTIRSGTGCIIAVPIWQQWASKSSGGDACHSGHLAAYLLVF